MSRFEDYLTSHNQIIDLNGKDEPIERWMNVLRDIGNYVVSKINPENQTKIGYELVPGYQVNIGQQVRLRLTYKDKHWSDTLFAVFIALDGSQLTFDSDLTGRLECHAEEEVFEAATKFLNSPQIKASLRTIKDFAYGGESEP